MSVADAMTTGCATGVPAPSTGSAACDQCIESGCEMEWCSCAADSHVDDAGAVSGCLGFSACLYACAHGNPDAGVAGGDFGACTKECGASYSGMQVMEGVALVSCVAMLCQTVSLACVQSGL